MCEKTMYRAVEVGEIFVTIPLPELERDPEFLMDIINKHVEMKDITLKNVGKDAVSVGVLDAAGFTELTQKLWVYRTVLKNFSDIRQFIKEVRR